MSFKRKMERRSETERLKAEATKIAGKAVDKAVERAYDEAVNTALAKVVAVSAEILYNDWSKLQKKETRLKAYIDLMQEKLQYVENPTENQLAVERLLDEQCGIKFGR